MRNLILLTALVLPALSAGAECAMEQANTIYREYSSAVLNMKVPFDESIPKYLAEPARKKFQADAEVFKRSVAGDQAVGIKWAEGVDRVGAALKISRSLRGVIPSDAEFNITGNEQSATLEYRWKEEKDDAERPGAVRYVTTTFTRKIIMECHGTWLVASEIQTSEREMVWKLDTGQSEAPQKSPGMGWSSP